MCIRRVRRRPRGAKCRMPSDCRTVLLGDPDASVQTSMYLCTVLVESVNGIETVLRLSAKRGLESNCMQQQFLGKHVL